MKTYLWIFLILLLILGIGIYILNNNSKDSYTAQRMSSNVNNVSENDIEDFKSETIEYVENQNEEKIAEFTTKLPNETEARDDNIRIACKALNGRELKPGEIFSLWEVLGNPTKEKGYEKAKTFTSEGEITKSYGGGICQLSTTIYNAVLKVDGLEIVERHEHSRDVPYIKDGKDAAVSYNTSDFKFKNTLSYSIKIEAQLEDKEVKIRLIRI